jgi:hypothetical protein
LIRPPDVWQSYRRRHLVGNQEELGEGNNKCSLRSDCFFLHAVKSYGMGADGFTSSQKEGVLWIFIALRTPPRRCMNPRTLRPMARTLTITPPRRLNLNLDTILFTIRTGWKNVFV